MRLAPAALVPALASGCSLLVSTSGLVGEHGVDAGLVADASAERSTPTEASADGAACGETTGPSMVHVTDRVCIDSTEVTRGQYRTFLASVGSAALAGLPAACSYKTSHVPVTWPPSAGQDNLPVVTVDWCDAWAFCRWAGKQLCGTFAGGQVAAAQAADSNVDVWFRACSGNGARTYPWGASFDPSKCNGPGAGRGDVVAVATMAGCEGGLAGVFDMAGNVQEWEDSCDGTSASSGCADRGGAFVHHDTQPTEDVRLTCAHRDTTARNSRPDNNGIRCCKYL